MVKLGVIGCGKWGKNYVRVFQETKDATVVRCADMDRANLDEVKERYPLINTSTNADEVTADDGIDAVVIATPASTHYEIAKKCLLAGKHVLLEKPMATSSAHCEELVQLAEKRNLSLMVGHTFLFNNGVIRMKDYLKSDDFGEMYYLHSRRNNLGPIREDVSVIWDLAPHDVSIFSYLLDAQPVAASAVGGAFLKKDRPDVAFITLTYPNGVIGNVQVSWVDSNKIRELVAIGSKMRIVFDDLDNLEKIRIFKKGISAYRPTESFGEFQYLLRDGDIVSPKIELHEPLANLAEQFLRSIEKGGAVSDGNTGLEVVKVLEAIESSLENGGAPVEVK